MVNQLIEKPEIIVEKALKRYHQYGFKPIKSKLSTVDFV